MEERLLWLGLGGVVVVGKEGRGIWMSMEWVGMGAPGLSGKVFGGVCLWSLEEFSIFSTTSSCTTIKHILRFSSSIVFFSSQSPNLGGRSQLTSLPSGSGVSLVACSTSLCFFNSSLRACSSTPNCCVLRLMESISSFHLCNFLESSSSFHRNICSIDTQEIIL